LNEGTAREDKNLGRRRIIQTLHKAMFTINAASNLPGSKIKAKGVVWFPTWLSLANASQVKSIQHSHISPLKGAKGIKWCIRIKPKQKVTENN
jgi:hypothetical protein